MVLESGSLSRILETAVVSARLAGQLAMEQVGYAKASIKNKDQLVTQADLRCQQAIIERIKETYPDDGFIAEEGKDGLLFKELPRGDRQVWWVIDPIDGTNNFAHQMLLFVVSIGVIYEGVPIAAVVFDPATDSMFTAVKGGYTQLNGRRITVGDEDINEFSSIGLDSHFPNPAPKWVCEIMQRSRFRNLGTTALQLAYVAKAAMIATISCTPKLWDITAGTLLVEQAGGIVTDWNGNKIFPVNTNDYQGQTIPTLAANKKVQPELLKLLK